jgi:hypothetical protein
MRCRYLPSEERRVHDVRETIGFAKRHASFQSLCFAFESQWHIRPSSKDPSFVPHALAMSQEDESWHCCHWRRAGSYRNVKTVAGLVKLNQFLD